MKQGDLLLVGAAVAALVLVVAKAPKAGGIKIAAPGASSVGYGGYSPLISGVPANSAPLNAVTEVVQPDGAAWGNGWRYFSDGTAISPDGVYYKNGAVAYDPATLYGNSGSGMYGGN